MEAVCMVMEALENYEHKFKVKIPKNKLRQRCYFTTDQFALKFAFFKKNNFKPSCLRLTFRGGRVSCFDANHYPPYYLSLQYDVIGHSGDGYDIELVSADKVPKNNKERLKVLKVSLGYLKKIIINQGRIDTDTTT